MPRQPNYNFERKERERIKMEKKAKRAAAKQEAREKPEALSDLSADDEDASGSSRSSDARGSN